MILTAEDLIAAEREGKIHISNSLLTIDQLRTDGTTINTEARGWVDLENDILKINLELISLKDFSKIISKIPWAGYAILGEDGSLSTSLLLSGNGPGTRASCQDLVSFY